MRKIFALAMLLLALTTAAQNPKDHNLDVAKNLDVFNAIYKNLDFMYVDTLNANEAVGTAINAMLRSLDPYTTYYPEDKAAEYKEMMTGKYAGVGAIISYNFKLKRVVVNEPYEGMPAADAGLRKGDIILSIDGEDMTQKNNQYVSDHLRGDAGTTLELKVLRPTTGKKLTMKITRKAIQMPYLPYYGMASDGIGYICYRQFIDGTSKDFRRAFLDLRQQGARKLVIDLRSNGGGNVQDAISIINMFVPKGKTLLTMRGKLKSSNQTFTSTVEPIDTVMPVVVLVNDETASASEITSGALQDLDRAVVLGTRTYGKGLVQVPNVPLPYNGNLKLTTAKYYIPSGRCIQAINYKHSKGGYTEHVPDSLTHVFHTAGGREVRDGGGIKPDIELEADSMPNIAIYLDRVDTTSVLLNYEVDYMRKHPTVAPAADFVLSDADYEELKQVIIKSGFTYDRMSDKCLKELKRVAQFEGYYDSAKDVFDTLEKRLSHDLARELDWPYNKQKIKELVALDLMAAYYYQKGAIVNSLRYDKQFKEAVRLLNSPDEYNAILTAGAKKKAKADKKD